MSDFTGKVRVLKTQSLSFPTRGEIPVIPTMEEIPVIVLDADNAVMSSGGHGKDASVQLSDDSGNLRASLHGGSGSLILREPPVSVGHFGQEAVALSANNSSIVLDVEGKHRIRLEGKKGDIWLGGNGVNGDIALFNVDGDNESLGKCTIWLDGGAGDIKLNNADCAEDFDTGVDFLEPGTVVVLGDDGTITQSVQPYDSRVAGVVSGAGGYLPGIVLDRRADRARRATIALLGKVFCRVDASHAAIEVGSLLVTSATPGHAMRAMDHSRAFGCVIGKALAPLSKGRELLPVLVALQ